MMMLRTGDLNPNPFAQGHVGMESLKQAMLQHEIIFRNQVRELHRLYWTQKNLMNELHQIGFDAHAPTSSSRVVMTKCCQGSTEEKNEFSESSCARKNVISMQQFKGRPAEVFSNHITNFSLLLPADDFIGGSCDNLPYGHTETDISKSGCGSEEAIAEKDMYYSASRFPCKKEVFDLEASVELQCYEAVNEVFSGFRAPIQSGTGMLGSQPTAFSDQVSSSTAGNEMHHITSMAQLDVEIIGRLPDQKPAISFVGLAETCIASVVDKSRIKQHKPVLIDLNLPHEDEYSHDLNDPVENINYNFSSSLEQDGILGDDQSNLVESPVVPRPASCSSVTKTSCENRADSNPLSLQESKLTLNTIKDKCDTENMVVVGTMIMPSSSQAQLECCRKLVEGSTDSNDGAPINTVSFSSITTYKQGRRDPDFLAGKLPSSEYAGKKRQDSNITSSNSTNLSPTVIRDSVSKLGIHEGSEEDTLSSHAIAHDEVQHTAPSKKFPTGLNSDGGTRKNRSANEDAALSNTVDSVATLLNSSQNDCFSMAQLMPVERDSIIAEAAETLMSISALETPAIPIDHQFDDVELIQADCSYRNNQPQYSSDSFEDMTLQLIEVQSEVNFSVSKPLNLPETEKAVNRIRLRKGRGLRDFQKEILPGLASLARHEICEDLHNIGHKLRRTASRNARENWFVPVRGRRSRLFCRRN